MKANLRLTLAVCSLFCLIIVWSCSDDDDGVRPPTTGDVEILSSPANAQVYVDGVDQQVQTPCTLASVEPGIYGLTLRKDLYNDWDSTVEVVAGKITAVEASLAEIEYTLTVNIIGPGSVTRSPDKPAYHLADSVELTAVPDSGYKFDSWSGDLEGSRNPDTIVMDTDHEVAASFVELILMSVTGTVSRADGEPLVNPYAFLDTSSTDSVRIFRSFGWRADAQTGRFHIQFEAEGLDSLLAVVSAYDDENGNRAIDPTEPLGWWDLDSNGTAETPNDCVLLRPHETVDGAEVVLYPGPYAASSCRKRPIGVILRLQ